MCANQYSQGRLVSIFEGGYNINLASMSPLVQSVASHVRALNTIHTGPLFHEKQQQAANEEEEEIASAEENNEG